MDCNCMIALETQQNHVLGRIALRDRAPRNPILSSCKGLEKGKEEERFLQIGSVSMITFRMDDYSWQIIHFPPQSPQSSRREQEHGESLDDP